MANKLIQLTADVVKKTGLEVYRDISMVADLNQANILKSYKEIIPMAYIANDSYISFYKDVGNRAVKVDKLSDMFNYTASCDIAKGKILYVTRSKMQSTTIDKGVVEGIELSVDTAYRFKQSVKVCDISAGWWRNSNNLQTIYNPAVDLSGYPLPGYEYLQGEMSALDFVKTGFNLKALISDTYYVEEFGTDPDSWVTCLKAEPRNPAPEVPIRTEDKNFELLMLQNIGEVSSMAELREYYKWNPYKLAKLVNVKAVFNSIHNIFTWTPGERILNPEFGSNLRKLLYEGITDFTTESIIAEIRRCILQYDDRVNIVTIKNASTVNDTENNTIQIDIVFTIPSLSREQFVYSYKYKQYDNE